MANTLTVATLNVNGLQNKQKRKAFFLWIKTLNFDIIFLQETHCHTRKDVKKWSREWGPGKNSIWSTGSSNSKGVAVLFKPHSNYKMTDNTIDTNGRYIYFELDIEDEIYKFINIYAPNDCYERVSFFQRLNSWIDIEKTNLVGGDFNCALDSELDRLNCSSKSDVGQVDLKNIIYNKSLEDVYRRRFPDKKTYSWSRGNKSSRLDYWLISQTLDCQIDQVDYLACPFSDHRLVTLKLNPSKIKYGPGTWKMNVSVIKSELFTKSFSSMWKKWQEQKNNYKLQTWWDLGKKKIKELTIWCASKLKTDNKTERNNLEFRLNKEQEKTNKDVNLVRTLEESLKNIMLREAEGTKIRSRLQWFEEGEKPTKFFHNLEKYNAQNKTWNKILNNNDELIFGTNGILIEQVEFYKKLYSSEGINQSEKENFGQYITKTISKDNFEMLNKEIELQDIFNAITKMKTNSSPGPDGIITEFYVIFYHMIKDDLLQLYKTSYVDRQLAYSQYLALIILLYKKGTREKITNWRPISLSNTDIKILTKILAERLKKVLPEIIHMNQSGCVKGRKIGQNIRMIEDILENMDDDSLILLVDQQKAFDRVEWEWLFYVLEKFNFGEYFINWIKILYKNMKSAIMTNGYISPYFNISRGIRQGDSLSALLYIIQSEPLSECIRCSEDIKGIPIKSAEGESHKIKGSQYVDDSNHMLYCVDYVHACLGLIDKFGDASGSRINKSKTVALVSEHFSDNREICKSFKLNKGIEIVLGVPIGKKQDKNQFWMEKFDKMQKILQLWKSRDLTMFGKVHVVKSLVLPLIQYAASHVDIDCEFVHKVQNLIWSFVWKWGTCFVSRDICYLPRQKGGLGMPNFDYIIKSARIKMIIDVMKCCAEWNILAKKYLCCLDNLYGIKHFALLVDDSSESVMKCKIPIFYKKCILAFQEMNRKGLKRCENGILWCNDKIRFEGNVLEYRHWSRDGIRYISDTIVNGKLDKTKMTQKLTNKSGFIFEFARLAKSIPDDIIQNCNPDASPSFDKCYYEIPGKSKLRHIYDLTTKDIYTIFVQGKDYERRSENYWTQKFHDVEIDFPKLYEKMFISNLVPRNILDFNWRIFNGQVLTEKKLMLMKLSNGVCSCCCLDNEDVIHLFVKCSYFTSLWTLVKQILAKIDNIVLQPFNQIFGFLSNNCQNDLMNMILSITRWCIWTRRCTLKYEPNGTRLSSINNEFKIVLKNHLMMMTKSHRFKDKPMQAHFYKILNALS